MTAPDDRARLARELRQRLETEAAFGIDSLALPPVRPAPHSSANPTPIHPEFQPDLPMAGESPSLPSTPLTPESKQSALDALAAELASCSRCPLGNTRTRLVFGEGSPSARIMFVGEAPGRDEDLQGRPFVGRAGQLLDRIIKAMGLDRSDVYIANILKCRPPENRTPLPTEVVHCLPFLRRQIDIIRPQLIICLGSVAAQNLLDTREGITRLRGRFLNFQSTKVMCTYHPAYLLRNPSAKADVWNDIQKALTFLGLPIPKH